jgi:hypothetical protein
VKKERVFHPLLFAIYPALALFAHNKALVALYQMVIPLVVISLSVLLFFYLLSFLLKNKKKAGLIVSLVVLLFFFYGHFYYLLEDFKPKIAGHIFDAYKMYFIISGIILPLGIYFSIRTRRNLDNLTKILNVIAVSLVLISLVNIGIFKIRSGAGRLRGVELEGVVGKGAEVTSYPNIYYIILDAYAREDILKEMYEYDNSDFINYLRGKGFYVADKSTSNYCQTVLSLSSSLNLQYLDNVVARIGVENRDRQKLTGMLRHNHVFKFLKQYGYITVSFDAVGLWAPIRLDNTDIFYRKSRLNLYEQILLDSTPIRIIMEKITNKKNYDYHRERILFAFNKVEEISKNKKRMFVFAHFLIPHMPFVFGENGEPINLDSKGSLMGHQGKIPEKWYRDNYKKQLTFLNKRVRRMIDNILANSSQPPIIVIQADHGPASTLDTESLDNTNPKERMTILNAYYLPGDGDKKLYPSISPVNTFRVIFNHYFKTNYPLLEDRSYFSTWSHPYKFFDVTDKVIDKK